MSVNLNIVPIPGYENFGATRDGRIFRVNPWTSTRHKSTKYPYELSQCVGSSGYLMVVKNSQDERDKVTVGEIRAIYMETLEGQIDTLKGLILKGYHGRHEAEKYLSETIGQTLTLIDNLNSAAGIPILRKSTEQGANQP